MAAPVYQPIVPYVDVVYAAAYWADRLNGEQWANASDAQKVKALNAATRYIDTLPFYGYKTDEAPAQVREFPRNGETVIPDEVLYATCELANWFLQGNTLETAARENALRSKSVGDTSESYATGMTDDYLGLPTPEVARLLAPWLSNPDTFRIDRVS